jgi:hypothetical protein
MFWAHFILKKRLFDIEKWVLILSGFALFSFTLNRLFVSAGFLHVDAKIFYCFRMLEYFLFFYIGVFASPSINCRTLMTLFVIWLAPIMVLQKLQLLGDISVEGYHSDASYRVSGTASFPSEMGALLSMLFCYFLYEPQKMVNWIYIPPIVQQIWQKIRTYILFFIFGLLTIWTGSRIAILAVLIAFFFKLKQEVSLRSVTSWLIALTCVIGGITFFSGVIAKTASLAERSAGLFSLVNFELFAKVWENIDITYDPIGRESVAEMGGDRSWWMRAHKWCYALKIYILNPECYLQGIGPGFAMSALDGGFMRILTEYGIIGSYFFWKFFRCIYQASFALKWVMVAFLMNMIFFDIYLAYKPMSFLFLMTGFAYQRRLQEIEDAKLAHIPLKV